MRTFVVRPEFSALREFTTSIPRTFDSMGRVIYNSRNVIKKINTDQGTLVVKNFKGMYFFNRLAYSLFRRSKAVRSYIYSGILNDRGIQTPPHVAWIDCYRLGLLTSSYFVSIFDPHETLDQVVRSLDGFERSGKLSLYRHLAAYALKLHRLDIYHEDLSLGNILVIRNRDRYQFALVDLNRIKFRKVSYEKGLRNFVTLRLPPEDLNIIIREYAMLSGQSPETAVEAFWKFENRKMFLRRLRRKIRRFTVGPLEKIFEVKHS